MERAQVVIGFAAVCNSYLEKFAMIRRVKTKAHASWCYKTQKRFQHVVRHSLIFFLTFSFPFNATSWRFIASVCLCVEFLFLYQLSFLSKSGF